MKSRFGRADAVALGLLAGTLAVTLGLYSRLPPRIPTHFDLHGVPNGWMSRSVGAWALPLVSVGVWLLLRPGAQVLPSPWRTRMQDSPMGIASALTVGLLSGLQWVTLYAALERPRSVGVALALLLEGFWIALGLLLPRVRRNPWLGVRTAWTLSSDENWARTHRVAGFAFCIGGACGVACTIAGVSGLGLFVVLASGMVPAVYSFLSARRLSDG